MEAGALEIIQHHQVQVSSDGELGNALPSPFTLSVCRGLSSVELCAPNFQCAEEMGSTVVT